MDFGSIRLYMEYRAVHHKSEYKTDGLPHV